MFRRWGPADRQKRVGSELVVCRTNGARAAPLRPRVIDVRLARTHNEGAPLGASKSGKESEVTITFEVHGDLARLEPETEVVLYRVAQEALRNAEHHAAATTIGLALRFEKRHVELTITDDGQGFDVPLSPGGYVQHGRLGLMGMYERAQLVGGSLHIESNPGIGTVVSAKIGRNGLTDPSSTGQEP